MSQPKLTEVEHELYKAIIGREGSGIWTKDLRKEVVGFASAVIGKALKSLQSKNLIKEVNSANNRKIVMGVEFKPTDEISGGAWYDEGALDVGLITELRQLCKMLIEKFKVTTCEMMRNAFTDPDIRNIFKMDITLKQIHEIVDLMVLDNEVEKLPSSGVGDFSHVPAGRECYRGLKGREGPKGALASMPCGVCPRISECTPVGDISPVNCVYYNKWLVDF